MQHPSLIGYLVGGLGLGFGLPMTLTVIVLCLLAVLGSALGALS